MENRFLLLIRYIVITIVVGTMVLFPQGIGHAYFDGHQIVIV